MPIDFKVTLNEDRTSNSLLMHRQQTVGCGSCYVKLSFEVKILVKKHQYNIFFAARDLNIFLGTCIIDKKQSFL